MAIPTNGSSFTNYGWAVCLWALIIAFQYGYHISVLNQIQAVLTCKATSPNSLPAPPRLLECIPMSDLTFSLVTSIFTIGGLAGSLVAHLVMDNLGRRGTHRICAIFIGIGAAFMGLSNSLVFILFGRFLTGIGSGLGLCVGPIFLAEIAPSKISGSVGVLTQLAIVSGIMFTQVAGINLAAPFTWRYVFFISFCLSGLQIFFSSMVVESPAFLLGKGRLEDHKTAARRLWGNTVPSLACKTIRNSKYIHSLLNNDSEDSLEPPRQENATILQVFTLKQLRKPLMIVSSAMLAQQISGINAVLYYSNDILAKSLPELGAYISLGVTVINVIMTFPPIILIEKLGRRRLLFISTVGQLVSLAFIGYSLDSGASTVASIAILIFVMSFAVGLGPIPFVIIPEVSPAYAVSALSSVALSINCKSSRIANFIVGLAFLPIRNLLSGGDMYKEGQVFYVFIAIFSAAAVWLFSVYKTSSTSSHMFYNAQLLQ
ncbi:general substrate transporter [Flammula alnicola]|nr:general substrate transporter [Flammula alnicola]